LRDLGRAGGDSRSHALDLLDAQRVRVNVDEGRRRLDYLRADPRALDATEPPA